MASGYKPAETICYLYVPKARPYSKKNKLFLSFTTAHEMMRP